MTHVKETIAKFISTSTLYAERSKTYPVADGVLAFVAFTIVLIMISLVGNSNILIFVGNLAICAIPFVFSYLRYQEVETLGITKNHILKSSLLGLAVGLAFFLLLPTRRLWPLNTPLQVITAVIADLHLYSSAYFVNSLLFFVIPVAVGEEVLFRGYIQTRVYGVIKNGWLAILTAGVMFAVLHFPLPIYRTAVMDGILISSLSSYISAVGNFFANYFTYQIFIFHVTMHVIFYYLYRKYNNLSAPVIVHFLLNLRQIFPSIQ